MKKTMILLVILLCVAVMMTACGKKEEETLPTAGIQYQPNALETPAPTSAPVQTVQNEDWGVPAGYDPASEEDASGMFYDGAYDEYGNLIQVGATPIPLDPLDMPTATPRPALAFNYKTYTVPGMNISFDAPGGWVVDESIPGTFKLYDNQVRDGYQGYVEINIMTVPSAFKKSELKESLKQTLETIHTEGNYTVSWSVGDVKDRTLMKSDGCYNTYRGERYDHVVVRGYVQLALVDGKLISVHVSAPGWYNSSYGDVYHKIRDTMKAVSAAQ